MKILYKQLQLQLKPYLHFCCFSSKPKILKIIKGAHNNPQYVYDSISDIEDNKANKEGKPELSINNIKTFGNIEHIVKKEIISTDGKEIVKENKLKTKSYFNDRCRVYFKAGDGGNGVIAFDKGSMMDQFRPNGGNGGKGGNIILQADSSVYSLAFLRKGHFTGNNGFKGQNKGKNGKDAKDLILQVPLGTKVSEIIRDTNVNKRDLRNDIPYKLKYLIELDKHGQTYIVCKGGDGGFGNNKGVTKNKTHSVNSDESKKGKSGQEKEIELELKVHSDVCLVGFPNAGKSTLMASVRIF